MIKIIVEITYASVLGAIGTAFAAYKAVCFVMDRYGIGERRKESKLMRDGMRNMMRELIRQAHSNYHSRGWIEEDELEHIEKVNETYRSLGGNGTAARWMKELENLPREEGKS